MCYNYSTFLVELLCRIFKNIPVYQGDSSRIEFDFIIVFYVTSFTILQSLFDYSFIQISTFLSIDSHLFMRCNRKYSDVEIDNNNKNFFVICSIRCSYHSFGPVYDAWIMFVPILLYFFFTYNDATFDFYDKDDDT